MSRDKSVAIKPQPVPMLVKARYGKQESRQGSAGAAAGANDGA